MFLIRFSLARIGIGMVVIGAFMAVEWFRGDESVGMQQLGNKAPLLGAGLFLLGLLVLGFHLKRARRKE